MSVAYKVQYQLLLECVPLSESWGNTLRSGLYWLNLLAANLVQMSASEQNLKITGCWDYVCTCIVFSPTMSSLTHSADETPPNQTTDPRRKYEHTILYSLYKLCLSE